MKPALIVLASVLGLLAADAAQAQFRKPGDAIEYRQSAMVLISQHFGRIAAMAKGTVPFDAKAAADNAALLVTLSKLPFDAFGPGTDTGDDTAAKPEIWKEADKFKKDAEDFQSAVAKLNTAAMGGKLDEIKAAVGATGKSCKACHDAFKDDKH